MTAAILGILGIGLGWWADAVAALVIGADVVKDGLSSLKRATEYLMDRRPTRLGKEEPESMPDEIRQLLAQFD